VPNAYGSTDYMPLQTYNEAICITWRWTCIFYLYITLSFCISHICSVYLNLYVCLWSERLLIDDQLWSQVGLCAVK